MIPKMPAPGLDPGVEAGRSGEIFAIRPSASKRRPEVTTTLDGCHAGMADAVSGTGGLFVAQRARGVAPRNRDQRLSSQNTQFSGFARSFSSNQLHQS